MTADYGAWPAGVTARPLIGKRVLVTRRAEQAGGLSERLRRYGAEVVEAPLIRIEPPTDAGAARRSIAEFAAYDIVIFTSVNAVAAVGTLATETGVDLRLPGPQVFAVGPATAEALGGRGIASEELPERFNAGGLAEQLGRHELAGRRVLLPRSEVGGEDLPAALRDQGALVDDVAAYRTTGEPDARARLQDVLVGLHVLTFASGSAVSAFAAAAPNGWTRPRDLVVAVIGPATASAAAAAGLEPDVVAANHTAKGLADAIAAYFVRS